MSRKINPIILRIPHNYIQKFKYIEKKPLESNLHVYKELETEQYIKNFFSNNGLSIHDLRLCFFNNRLDIFISYYSSTKIDSVLVTEINDLREYKISKNFKQDKNKINLLAKSTKKKLERYHGLKFLGKHRFIKNKKNKKLVRSFNNYNFYLFNASKNIANLRFNYFLHQFFESLSLFTNKKLNLSLTLKQLNDTIKYNITKKSFQILSKSLVKLRKYESYEFFKEGVHVIFLAITNKHSASLLAIFIATCLQKFKRHNLFIRFLKTILLLFYDKSFSIVKGLKIQISGRLNGRPRAKTKSIEIGSIPILKISSKIDYYETTSFTLNGTFGIKVFIYEKTN
uniref:Ribosomal protein S3 n=1 Tax=Proschkinia sp. SZCZR1824 TaxID=2588390 RepID=A0A4Y5SFJ4_9STRA|nr:ribosomal protein S3 [Proschkinia sp. SZCZR1824]